MQIKAEPARFGQSASMRDPEHWRQQASWAAAGRLRDPWLSEAMARVAVGYEQLADAYERLLAGWPTGRPIAARTQGCPRDEKPAA